MRQKSLLGSFKICFYIMLFLFLSAIVFFPGIRDITAQQAASVSDIYIVTKGDTLWNISEEFFGDPQLWPALWQINPHIKDPHWIYPGEIINLIKLTPPSLSSVPLQQPLKPLKEITEGEIQPEIPATKEPVYAVTQDKIDSCSYLLPQAVFHQKEKEEGWGKIVKSKEEKISLSYLDYIYIDLGEGDVVPGQIMTVFKIARDLKDNEKLDMPHYMVSILGKAEIKEVYDNISLAKIIKSYSEISIGDMVKQYEAMPRPVLKPPKIKELYGEILESEAPKVNLSEFDIVFLNMGKWTGIEPGNPLEIYRFENIKIGPPDAQETKRIIRPLGELLVLRGEEWTSTALITKSYQPILLGDHVRIYED
ncbi:MAG: LysM peptidoglycan-binding domain-containing protein [bacterium]